MYNYVKSRRTTGISGPRSGVSSLFWPKSRSKHSFMSNRTSGLMQSEEDAIVRYSLLNSISNLFEVRECE